jgi:hypothetical protein
LPLSKDSQKTLDHFKDQYGDKKGEEYFYRWINEHGLDDEKPLDEQKGKMHSEAFACPQCDMHRAFTLKDERLGKEPDQKLAQADNMVTDLVEPKADATGPDKDVVPTQKTERDEKEVKFQKEYQEAHHLETPPAPGIPYEPHKEATGPDKDVVPTQKTERNEKEKNSDLVSPQEPFERYKEQHPQFYNKASAQFQMPTLHYAMQFKADPSGALSTGEIRGTGVLVSQTDVENKNGWRIGKYGKEKEEFESIANQIKASYDATKPVQVRLQHSDQPDKIIGGFYAGEADIRAGYYGLNTTFFMNPKDPQVRYNIERGLLRDMSIGLDANAFCAACDKPLRQNAEGGSQMWDYDCEHLGSPVYLTGCRIREGSIVSEPAFEGSNFKIGFAAALENALPKRSFNPNSPSSDSVNSMSGQVSVDAAKASKKAEGAENPFEALGMDERDQLLIKSKAYKAWKAKMLGSLDAKEEDEEKMEARAKGEAEGDAEGEAEGKASRAKAYSDPNLGRDYKQVNEAPRKDMPPDSKNVIPAKAKAEGEAEGEGEADAKAKAQASKESRKITSKTTTVAPAPYQTNAWNAAADTMTQEIMAIYQKKKEGFHARIS